MGDVATVETIDIDEIMNEMDQGLSSRQAAAKYGRTKDYWNRLYIKHRGRRVTAPSDQSTFAPPRTEQEEFSVQSMLNNLGKLTEKMERIAEDPKNSGKKMQLDALMSQASIYVKIMEAGVKYQAMRQKDITAHPDYLELQAKILAALRPHPEALKAVLAALGVS